MLHLSASELKKTGQKSYDGQHEVMVTDAHGNKFVTYMTDDEIKITELLKKVEDVKLRKDPLECIEDYAQQKYSEGYDEGNMDGRTLDY